MRIHDLKRLEKVKADMKLEDVKVRRPSPIYFCDLIIDVLHPPSLDSQCVTPFAPLYPGQKHAGCEHGMLCIIIDEKATAIPNQQTKMIDKENCCLPVQDMDMGVLFCTYSLLNQKSKSTKDIYQTIERNPTSYGHRHILDIHERTAAQEASRGELEFGEAQPHLCRQSLCQACRSLQPSVSL